MSLQLVDPKVKHFCWPGDCLVTAQRSRGLWHVWSCFWHVNSHATFASLLPCRRESLSQAEEAGRHVFAFLHKDHCRLPSCHAYTMWTHLLRVSSLEVGSALAKAQINKSPLLAEYRNHPKLAKRHGVCIFAYFEWSCRILVYYFKSAPFANCLKCLSRL